MSLMKPTHKHDCPKCEFITATTNSQGRLTDWYGCGGVTKHTVNGKAVKLEATLIGRYSDEGSDYWSMDTSTLGSNVFKAAYIQRDDKYAHSEELFIAWQVFCIWREG